MVGDVELIAKYMNVKYQFRGSRDRLDIVVWKGGKWMYQRYAYSWDWLMPVVEKIHRSRNTVALNFQLIAQNTEVSIFNGDMNEQVFVDENSTSIKAVYNAVVSYIKWYNKTYIEPPLSDLEIEIQAMVEKVKTMTTLEAVKYITKYVHDSNDMAIKLYELSKLPSIFDRKK